MLALYRCGRQADALATYAELRRRLVDELGIEPSKSLRQLEQSILNQERELDAPGRPRGAGPGPPPDDPPAPGRRPLSRPAAAAAAAVIVAAAVALPLTLGASSSRAVSVGPNTVVRIDPHSTRVVAAVPVGLTPTSVSAGEGAVWTLNADDQTLSRIDPGTNLAQSFGSGGIPTDVAAGGGAVWVGNGERSRGQYVGPVATTVSRINPDTRAIYATVALPPAGSTPSNLNQNHIAVGPSGVWVVGPDASVSRVDVDCRDHRHHSLRLGRCGRDRRWTGVGSRNRSPDRAHRSAHEERRNGADSNRRLRARARSRSAGARSGSPTPTTARSRA